MGFVGIRWLRSWILILAIVSLAWSSFCYNQPLFTYNAHSGSYCYQKEYIESGWMSIAQWIPIPISAIIVLSYAYSLKGKPVIQRSARAFFISVLFGLALFDGILYSYIRYNYDYSGYPLLVAGVFMIVEMLWTLWDTRPKRPDVIIVSPEMPKNDYTTVSPIEYVYPDPLPQPQAGTPDTQFITVGPLPPNVKSSPQSQSEMALEHSPQNQEIPHPSHLTTHVSPLAPQLLPQAPQNYETPQFPPQAPQYYGTLQLSPQAPQYYGTPQLSPQAPQFYGTPQFSPQAPQFYGISNQDELQK